MRKVNLKVQAEQEAFEFLNSVGDTYGDVDESTFYDRAGERFEARANAYRDLDDELFYIQQAADYYTKYIKGHTYEEICANKILGERYSIWSDLYKDAHGFRPRFV